MQNSYWIYAWIDHEGINTLGDAERCLRDKASLRRLIEYAERQSHTQRLSAPNMDRILVAGNGLDLSGHLQCMQNECALKAVDMTVHHTWHSFDCVVVEGLDSREFMRLIKRREGELVLGRDVLPHVRIALYVRDTGADELLYFMDRPRGFCTDHYHQALTIAGLAAGLDSAADRLANKLLDGYRLEIFNKHDGTISCFFAHPALDTAMHVRFPAGSQKTEQGIAQELAKDIAYGYAASTVQNSVLARDLSASLGQLTAIDDIEWGRLTSQQVAANDIAYNLSIPIVNNLSLRELMAIRRDHLGEFHAFQAAIRKAIEERLKATPAENSYRIAQSVYDDVLEPALNDMERRLQKAAEIFMKKSAAAVTVGTIMATVGLLTFAPIAAPGMVIAAGGLLASYNELLKDKREVQLSDLHFLWKLSARAARHA